MSFAATGESYAGVYVPLLAQAMLDADDDGAQPAIPLKVSSRSTIIHTIALMVSSGPIISRSIALSREPAILDNDH